MAVVRWPQAMRRRGRATGNDQRRTANGQRFANDRLVPDRRRMGNGERRGCWSASGATCGRRRRTSGRRPAGLRYTATSEAVKFKAISCPIDTFVTGLDSTTSNQRDLAITTLNVEPSPVYVKGRMTLRATVNAVGCENAPVTANLYVDDREVTIERKFVNKEEVENGNPQFPLREKNDFVVEATAPQVPGEVGAAKIKIAIGQLEIFVFDFALDWEWWNFGTV